MAESLPPEPSAAPSPGIRVESRDAVTTITLDRPERLNALDRDLSMALISAVEGVGRDPSCRFLVITGAGRAFCAGQYLGKAGEEDLPSDIAQLIRDRYSPLVLGLRRLRLPVLAAVNGLATGAGLSLALAADLRVCSDAAWFSCGFSQIGLIPDSGATYFLARLLGPGRALDLALTGRRISADGALAVGLVSEVFPAEDFATQSQVLAKRLAEGATWALGMTKRLLYDALESTLEDQLEREALFQQEASETADFREGLAAFHQRRPPHFTGS
jgi:2-(1,2-epoxy-1,2-dihydrophenyl)acetyl-CoA isomerase